MTAVDAPLAFSPAGICNRSAAAAGRPAETARTVVAWRWDHVREVGRARGWLFVNGRVFCRDTGHLGAAELLALARLEPAAREERLRGIMRRWFRPLHLRRKARVIEGRTHVAAVLNVITFAGWMALTAYVVGDVATRIPPGASAVIAEVMPWLVVALMALHFVAVAFAWRAVRRLRINGADKRGANLGSALLLPPQAMRLRALAGEGVFPAQHPLAAIVAFGDRRAIEEYGFNALADLCWPIGEEDDSAEARDVARWFRHEMREQLERLLERADVSAQRLLEPPSPDAPTSCTYCPRCGDQFVAGVETCANGVRLRPLRGKETRPMSRA